MIVSRSLVAGVLISAALGLAVSDGSPLGLAVSILAPAVWLRQSSRDGSYLCAAAYYLTALRSLPLVSDNFFGPESGLAAGVCFWITAAGILSLPWLWVWTRSARAAFWRCPAGLLLTIIPPLGLIGWASPIAAAGLLFPATGFVGLAPTLCLPGALVAARKLGLATVLAGVLLAHVLAGPTPLSPGDWAATNTHFGPISHVPIGPLREYQIEQAVQSQAINSSARVIIFPEAVVPRWTAVTDLFWSDTIRTLRRSGKTILVGALRLQMDTPQFDFAETLASLQSPNAPSYVHRSTATASPSYDNEVIVRGAQAGEFVQRVPVPIGMWKPLTGTGVPLRLINPGTISIGGRRTALIICYEQLIPWPVLTSFIERPSILVAIANNVWMNGTPIPNVEQTTMRAWAALFRVPIVFAANT
jgi:hypothetical protein